MPHQKGIGLPELLIALLLSSFIMTGLMQHYLSTKKQYGDIQKKLERSIDLQLVTDLIRDSVRKAGFTPCLSINHLIKLDQRPEPKPLIDLELGSGATSWLRVSRMSEHFDTVLQIINPTQLLVTAINPIAVSQSVIIVDCYHAEVQNVNQIKHASNGQIVTLSKPLAFSYHQPIYIGEWLEETYSIRLGKDGKNALFYQRRHAEELTNAINALSAHLNKEQGHTLLQIILGVEQVGPLKLETMVRAC